MASKVYPSFKAAVLQGTYNLSSATVRAVLIDTGTVSYNAAHDFYNDISAGVVGTESGGLANKTFTNGTFDADNITFSAVTGSTVEALIYFVDTGTASADALICWVDGKVEVEVAVDASTSATSITVEDLPGAIASGATLTKISGTGPTTVTTSAGASASARTLSVSALSSGITAGAVYEYAVSGTGLPVTPNGGDITISHNASGIFNW